jgi:hypothetical protein
MERGRDSRDEFTAEAEISEPGGLMSDYLGNLAARSLNLVEIVRPRVASRFEPVDGQMFNGLSDILEQFQEQYAIEPDNRNISVSRTKQSNDNIQALTYSDSKTEPKNDRIVSPLNMTKEQPSHQSRRYGSIVSKMKHEVEYHDPYESEIISHDEKKPTETFIEVSGAKELPFESIGVVKYHFTEDFKGKEAEPEKVETTNDPTYQKDQIKMISTENPQAETSLKSFAIDKPPNQVAPFDLDIDTVSSGSHENLLQKKVSEGIEYSRSDVWEDDRDQNRSENRGDDSSALPSIMAGNNLENLQAETSKGTLSLKKSPDQGGNGSHTLSWPLKGSFYRETNPVSTESQSNKSQKRAPKEIDYYQTNVRDRERDPNRSAENDADESMILGAMKPRNPSKKNSFADIKQAAENIQMIPMKEIAEGKSPKTRFKSEYQTIRKAIRDQTISTIRREALAKSASVQTVQASTRDILPEIQVTIGRIEVRAASSAPLIKKRQMPALMSLDDYLRRRAGGK